MSKKDHRTKGTYILPRVDSGFKILFGSENTKDILAAFLNDVLDINKSDPISDIEFMDKEKPHTRNVDRGTVYDIHCTTSTGHRFIVEMQNYPQPNFLDRSIFYAARAITEQARSGKWSYTYMPVYGVFICDFAIPGKEWKGNVKIESDLRIKGSNEPLTDKLRLIYIQLSEFEKKDPAECSDDFERWVYILKYLETMSTIPFAGMKEAFRRVENVGRVENLTGEALAQYEHDLKAYRDYHAQLAYAETKGLTQGFDKGFDKGVAKGMEEGREAERRENIRMMLSFGVPMDAIASKFGMTPEEITKFID